MKIIYVYYTLQGDEIFCGLLCMHNYDWINQNIWKFMFCSYGDTVPNTLILATSVEISLIIKQ